MTTVAFYSRLFPWASGALLAVVINAILTIALLTSIADETLPAVIMAGRCRTAAGTRQVVFAGRPVTDGPVPGAVAGDVIGVAANLGALQSGAGPVAFRGHPPLPLSRAQLGAQLAQLDAQLARITGPLIVISHSTGSAPGRRHCRRLTVRLPPSALVWLRVSMPCRSWRPG